MDKLRYERTQIVSEGSLQLENIEWSYSHIGISFNKNERSIINTEWDTETAKKPSLFDGKLFHVKKQEFRPPHLIFNACVSSFKEWVGTKSDNFKRAWPKKDCQTTFSGLGGSYS